MGLENSYRSLVNMVIVFEENIFKKFTKWESVFLEKRQQKKYVLNR